MAMTPIGSNPVSFARQVTPAGSSQSANSAEPTVAAFLETPRYDTVELAKEKKLPQFDFENFPEFKTREELTKNGEPVFSYSSYMVYGSISSTPYFSELVPTPSNPDVFNQLAESYLTAKDKIISGGTIYHCGDYLSTEELIEDLDKQFRIAIHDIARGTAYKATDVLARGKMGMDRYLQIFHMDEGMASFDISEERLAEYDAQIGKSIYDDMGVYGKLLYEKLTSSSLPAEGFDAAAYLAEQAKGLDTNFSVSELRDFSTALGALKSGDGEALAGALIHLDNTDKTSGNSILFDNMKNLLNRRVFIDVILRPEEVYLGEMSVTGVMPGEEERRDRFNERKEQGLETKEQFLQYMKAHQNADKPNAIMELLARNGEAYYGETIRAFEVERWKERLQAFEKSVRHLWDQQPKGQTAELLLSNGKTQGMDISQIIAAFLRERGQESYSSFFDLKEPGIPSDE